MDECWDDEYEKATPIVQNNTNKYIPPFKRVSDGNSIDAWNTSSSENQYVSDVSHSGQNRRAYSDRQSYQDRPNNTRGQRQSRDDRFPRKNDDSIEIEIDSNKVGKVIGRGGSKIQELQEESGARIQISKEESVNFGSTAIRIIGSVDSRNKAKTLIEELTSDFGRMSTNNTTNYGYSSNSSFYNETSQSEESGVIDWDKIYKQSEEYLKKKLESLPPIMKEFYREDPEVTAMSKKEVFEFRRANNNISVNTVDDDDDRPIPNPVSNFKHAFQDYPELLVELRKQSFTTPSPIQSQAWPILLRGYDMIGIAQTGTGKTIAFLFPALIHIVNQVTPRHERVGPTCLILAPTRELAQQIESETKKYTYKNINCVCIYGGGSRRNQINVVTKGVDIVIATPGRLNDLVMNKIVDVTGVSYLVLDEADRMLDMGFEPQIRKIVLDIRPDRQTVMTSATWTNEIQKLAARYMKKPFKVNVGALDLAAVHSVTQEIVLAEDEDRRALLSEFISNMGPDDKVIVFVERKAIADDLSSDLLLQGIPLQSIHGDREQCDREQALNDLKTGTVRILIATDVASRGLDIKDITHVFNMYFPRNIEEYVHRVGRTGRAGRTGHAISIFTRQDWMQASALIKILEEADQYVPDELYQMADRYKSWKQRKQAEEDAYGGRRGRGGGRRRF